MEQENNKKLKGGSSTDSQENEQLAVKETHTTSSAASRSNSNLGSNSTKIQSPSQSSNSPGGFDQTNKHWRSVLMHPLCFPLLIYLNDVDKTANSNFPKYVRAVLDGFKSEDDLSKLELVFAATAMDWVSGETDFTQKLLYNMNYCKIGVPRITTTREKQIVGERGKTGILGFVFLDKERSTGKSSVVALFEFGLSINMWWTKQDQILQYVKMLKAGTDPNYKFDQPMLLSVITIERENTGTNKSSNVEKCAWKELNANEKNDTFDSNLQKIRKNEKLATGLEKNPLKARFGVFICIPKGKTDFRIALLWRHDAETLMDASIQYGKILYAVQLCSYLRNLSSWNENEIQYEYLGPNCCKLGDRVSFLLSLVNLSSSGYLI